MWLHWNWRKALSVSLISSWAAIQKTLSLFQLLCKTDDALEIKSGDKNTHTGFLCPVFFKFVSFIVNECLDLHGMLSALVLFILERCPLCLFFSRLCLECLCFLWVRALCAVWGKESAKFFRFVCSHVVCTVVAWDTQALTVAFTILRSRSVLSILFLPFTWIEISQMFERKTLLSFVLWNFAWRSGYCWILWIRP